MPANIATAGGSQPSAPREARGIGKVIRHDPAGYGHVELSVAPSEPLSEIAVKWEVIGGTIPEAQRPGIIDAIEAVLSEHMSRHLLRSGVTVTVEYGSYHEIDAPLHTEAARIALADALRRGAFFTRPA